MTSIRKIEANRRNAVRSTGPNTAAGKQRSRQNAIRHGLCAETVVGVLEDIDDYKGFEAAIIADFNAETAVERELVLRLASLLWRIRRATAIESELFQIQAEILRERRLDQSLIYLKFGGRRIPCETDDSSGKDSGTSGGHELNPPWTSDAASPARDLAYCFQRLVNLDGATLERLGRYEPALSRQIVQVLFLLRQQTRRPHADRWT